MQDRIIPFSYIIKRSAKRRTLAIVIRRNKVSVMAPWWVLPKTIDEFVIERRDWVKARLDDNFVEAEKDMPIVSGIEVSVFGEIKKLEVVTGKSFALTESESGLAITVPKRVLDKNRQSYLKSKLIAFYSDRLQSYLNNAVLLFQSKMNLQPSSVSVKKYKAKWGSCSREGHLCFNWRLAMLDDELIDYVIVHEMAHLVHFNHSASFWHLVNEHCSEYKKLTAMMKMNNHIEIGRLPIK